MTHYYFKTKICIARFIAIADTAVSVSNATVLHPGLEVESTLANVLLLLTEVR